MNNGDSFAQFYSKEKKNKSKRRAPLERKLKNNI